MMQDQTDPVIDEIRQVRREISTRFDHDPKRLVDYYMKLQENHRERMLDQTKTREPIDQSAA
jgi:hypothetical protein